MHNTARLALPMPGLRGAPAARRWPRARCLAPFRLPWLLHDAACPLLAQGPALPAPELIFPAPPCCRRARAAGLPGLAHAGQRAGQPDGPVQQQGLAAGGAREASGACLRASLPCCVQRLRHRLERGGGARLPRRAGPWAQLQSAAAAPARASPAHCSPRCPRHFVSVCRCSSLLLGMEDGVPGILSVGAACLLNGFLSCAELAGTSGAACGRPYCPAKLARPHPALQSSNCDVLSSLPPGDDEPAAWPRLPAPAAGPGAGRAERRARGEPAPSCLAWGHGRTLRRRGRRRR